MLGIETPFILNNYSTPRAKVFYLFTNLQFSYCNSIVRLTFVKLRVKKPPVKNFNEMPQTQVSCKQNVSLSLAK